MIDDRISAEVLIAKVRPLREAFDAIPTRSEEFERWRKARKHVIELEEFLHYIRKEAAYLGNAGADSS